MIAVWLAACLPARFAEDAPQGAVDTSDTPSAETLLARVRASIPQETLVIKGHLMKGARVGRLEQAFGIEALLEWGQHPPSARYTLNDAFGTPLARLTLIRPPGRTPEFRYEQGRPLKPAPTPDLNQPIEGTELTWNDLSLSFLWWPDGTVAGRDNIRGRDCFVVEVPAQAQPGKPPAELGASGPSGEAGASDAVGSVRLWIDDRLVVLIQIEEYDAEGKLMRRLSVKSIKKIGDLWMIKNMDVRRYPSHHRTQIRIEEMNSATSSNAPEVDLRD